MPLAPLVELVVLGSLRRLPAPVSHTRAAVAALVATAVVLVGLALMVAALGPTEAQAQMARLALPTLEAVAEGEQGAVEQAAPALSRCYSDRWSDGTFCKSR